MQSVKQNNGQRYKKGQAKGRDPKTSIVKTQGDYTLEIAGNAYHNREND